MPRMPQTDGSRRAIGMACARITQAAASRASKADVIRSLAGRFPAFPNRFIDSLPTTHAHIRHSPDRHQLQHASGADSGRCLPHPARPWIEHSVTATPRWECGIRDAECGMRGDVTPPRLEGSELWSLHRNTEILGCSCCCC